MERKKILYTATTNIHILNFHLPYLEWFRSQGYEVHVACNGNPDIPGADKVFTVPFGRSPFDSTNRRAFRQLKQIIREHHYELIHAHTPMGGIVTRMAARGARKSGTKVLYTAHGFHFYKGAALKNWLVFFPIEWFFARFTDAIITINNEDFATLSSMNFPSAGKFKTDGIGINPDRLDISGYDRATIRHEMGIGEDEVVILYIAEFIPRKNHRFIFESIPAILEKAPNTRFVFAGGKAALGDQMIAYAKANGFEDRIIVLGYHPEIARFISIADIGISSSHAEGLPIGIAEIMSKGLPVVISDIRGHNELVAHGKSGFLYERTSRQAFVEAVVRLCQNAVLRKQIGDEGAQYVKKFDLRNPLEQTIAIYNRYLDTKPKPDRDVQ